MRLVVDTNLVIRALLSAGPARQFFKLAPLQHQILYHAEQFAELRDVAARPRLNIASEAVSELVDRMARYGALWRARRLRFEYEARLSRPEG